ncbi:hypothetical protein KIN20_033085 [Parelaphostrongylus tenuis]|uniref:C2H2-type domain-containing protein n=1 Tax=Parelaphostrongylus tenuis TaxID=148309 RepID=A0AAD5WIY6_PARTN|nr:hypothetical protein KIN20_033085 [Parelaphostrongylus tenuis]
MGWTFAPISDYESAHFEHCGQEASRAYISEVARRYRERMRKMKERSQLTDGKCDSTSASLIKQRLLYLVGECDIDRATCRIPMCGRVFSTIQVLAWHMSYSHHDLASESTYGTLCFVCGIRMNTVKQCVYQRQPVISPLAPAATRIAQCAIDEDLDGDYTCQENSFPFREDFRYHKNHQ